MYDSRIDTYEHIQKVRLYLNLLITSLNNRALVHDQSKLEEPELKVFNEHTPKLKNLTFGSPEYKASLLEMREGLLHHYQHNSHHPEHYAQGIKGMNLVDLVEMLCDWKAASERHADGDIYKSIKINQEKHQYSDDLKAIFENTVRDFFYEQP